MFVSPSEFHFLSIIIHYFFPFVQPGSKSLLGRCRGHILNPLTQNSVYQRKLLFFFCKLSLKPSKLLLPGYANLTGIELRAMFCIIPSSKKFTSKLEPP